MPVWVVAELNCFWGEQLGVGFGLPPERGCDHTLRTGAGLVTITTLIVRQPLDVVSLAAGGWGGGGCAAKNTVRLVAE